MANQPGLLLAFDGVDSSGKETQTKKLAERLRFNGFTVHQFTTPDYTTPSGQELKLRLQGKLGNWQETPWEEKMRYFSANRAEHRDEVMQALKRGEIVMYDRYVMSSVAFITVEGLAPQDIDLYRDKFHRAIMREEYEVKKMPHEHVSIFLDVPPRIAAELLEKRKEKLADEDEYTDHVHVQERLYNEYDVMIEQRPTHFLRIPCVNGTELLSVAATAELVWEGLNARFADFFAHHGHRPAR